MVELLVVIVVVIVLVLVLLPMMGRTNHHGGRQIKDSTQVRGIHQGMVLWAQNNSDVYPLPSVIDAKDETVAERGRAKDTTANIMSVLMYNGFFSPELCVSPAESNGNIQVFGNYSYSNPASAVRPEKALWDPAFSADFTGPKKGNFSYGHMLPADARLEKTWTNNFQAGQAVIGNRGPLVTAMATEKGNRRYAAAASNTYLIHGGRNTWEGNIAYNDDHVDFVTRIDPESNTYKDAAGKEWFDCLFFDEPDDPTTINNYLGIFTKAGATGAEYRAIWD